MATMMYIWDAEQGGRVSLTRRGKPVAFLISVSEYDRLTAGRTDFVAALIDFRARNDLAELDLGQTAEWYGRERARLVAAGLTPSFPDGQIAAVARTQGLVVITANLGDFMYFDGLEIRSWRA